MDSNVEQFRKSFDIMLSGKLNRQKMVKSSAATENLREGIVARADSALLPAIQEEYSMQRPIRQWFGKATGVNCGRIGCHPDFAALEGTDKQEYHYITTMFVDIRNSTRLSLCYPLEDVQHIKNSILRVASETVRAMDGHVHRFMGDALMAYFGGRSQTKETTAMAAICCSAMLRTVMHEAVVPALNAREIDAKDLGFRVGIDFGDDQEVLWSSYGFSDVNEVTATSFYVDASAKLQSMAAKDCTMLGDNLLKLLDFPEILTTEKKVMREGQHIGVPFLQPNYQLPSESPVNYSIRELNYEAVARLLPIPTELKEGFAPEIVSRNGIRFFAEVIDEFGLRPYPSMSSCLPKGVTVQFNLTIDPIALKSLRLPINGRFIKQNHGHEAESYVQVSPEIVKFSYSPEPRDLRENKSYKKRFERITAYRGIHVVTIEIHDERGRQVFKEAVGVHVC